MTPARTQNRRSTRRIDRRPRRRRSGGRGPIAGARRRAPGHPRHRRCTAVCRARRGRGIVGAAPSRFRRRAGRAPRAGCVSSASTARHPGRPGSAYRSARSRPSMSSRRSVSSSTSEDTNPGAASDDADSATAPGMSVSTLRPNSSSKARSTTWMRRIERDRRERAMDVGDVPVRGEHAARAPGMPQARSASGSAASPSTMATPRRRGDRDVAWLRRHGRGRRPARPAGRAPRARGGRAPPARTPRRGPAARSCAIERSAPGAADQGGDGVRAGRRRAGRARVRGRRSGRRGRGVRSGRLGARAPPRRRSRRSRRAGRGG